MWMSDVTAKRQAAVNNGRVERTAAGLGVVPVAHRPRLQQTRPVFNHPQSVVLWSRASVAAVAPCQVPRRLRTRQLTTLPHRHRPKLHGGQFPVCPLLTNLSWLWLSFFINLWTFYVSFICISARCQLLLFVMLCLNFWTNNIMTIMTLQAAVHWLTVFKAKLKTNIFRQTFRPSD